jgi:hypothetical protein
MSLLDDDNTIDVYQVLAKTLYYGMFINVLLSTRITTFRTRAATWPTRCLLSLVCWL